MQITEIAYRRIDLTMKQSFQTAHDRTKKRPLMLIELTIDHQATGYGEVQAFENHEYAPQNQEDAQKWLDKNVPTIVGYQGNSLEDLLNGLPEDGQFARAGLEMAIWDAVGKLSNRSLADMLGEHSNQVPVSIALGLEDFESLSSAYEQGYKRIKLKQAGRKVSLIQEVTTRYPNQRFSLDFNASLPLSVETMTYLSELRDLGIDLIEEPFADAEYSTYKNVQKILEPMKISLDEQLNGLSDVNRWLENSEVSAFTLKQGKLGGISVLLSAQKNILIAKRLPWIGGMLASGLGRAVDAALTSQLPQPQYPADISKETRYFTNDITIHDLTFRNGYAQVPTEPGIGVELDWNAIHTQQIGEVKRFNLLQKG